VAVEVPATRAPDEVPPQPARVQSLDRAFAVLEAVADAGGTARIVDIAERTGLPQPTIHRLARSLVANGTLRQEQSRSYSLGPRLIRLGDRAAHLLGSWAMPHLGRLATEIGETANLAMFEGDAVVYVAQVPSVHSMRMFTEVGRRVDAHSTGVGKALLCQLRDDEVRALVQRTGMTAQTPRTRVTVEALLADLAEVRERGYALDDGEQELGVRCVAVPLVGAPRRAAVSVSGPSSRLTLERLGELLPVLQRVAEDLCTEMRDLTA
jgi:IclR family transcriptional regulator, acetate operon repressor